MPNVGVSEILLTAVMLEKTLELAVVKRSLQFPQKLILI